MARGESRNKERTTDDDIEVSDRRLMMILNDILCVEGLSKSFTYVDVNI